MDQPMFHDVFSWVCFHYRWYQTMQGLVHISIHVNMRTCVLGQGSNSERIALIVCWSEVLHLVVHIGFPWGGHRSLGACQSGKPRNLGWLTADWWPGLLEMYNLDTANRIVAYSHLICQIICHLFTTWSCDELAEWLPVCIWSIFVTDHSTTLIRVPIPAKLELIALLCQPAAIYMQLHVYRNLS